MVMMILCPKADSLAFTPPGDEVVCGTKEKGGKH